MKQVANATKLFVLKSQMEQEIVKQTRKDKGIVYGARSINAQAGIFSRPTQDWDIFTKNPKKSAMKIEKKMDRISGGDNYYSKKGVHKGTWKVKGKGFDKRKGTRDDTGIIDYSKTPSPKPPVVLIRGVRFRTLTQEIKAKRKSIADPNFAFRHAKDKEDLMRMRALKI